MKQYASMLYIDGNKLRDILNERKLSPSKISEELGFSRFYITNHIHLGSMPEAVINDLRDFYEIYPDWYVSNARIPATSLNRNGNVAIDRYKFESILSTRKLTKKAIYEKLGISKDALNNILRRGYLSKKYCISLANEFHIYAEDYEPDKKEEEPMFKTVYNGKEIPTVKEEEPVVDAIIHEEPPKPKKYYDISKVMEEAAYRGTMRALVEFFGIGE